MSEIVWQKDNVRIVRFGTRTPWPPSHANAYLIDDEVVTLVDTGLCLDESIQMIEDYLNSRKLRIHRIVITHGHIDHYGAVGAFRERYPSAVVLCHKADADKLTRKVSEGIEEASETMREFFTSQGVPETAVHMSGEMLRILDGVVCPVYDIEFLKGGEVLESGAIKLKVVHVPGHSPGQVVLYDEKHGILFSGDHVLSKKPPTPLIEMTGEGKFFNNIIHYVDSLHYVRNFKVQLVLPGHWRTFEDLSTKVDALLKYYEMKKWETKNVLEKAGRPMNAYEIARALFPEMPEGVFFIGVSEAIGYLSLLEKDGEVVADKTSHPVLYHLV